MFTTRHMHGLTTTRPLSDDDIRRHAPATFATVEHTSRSDRYKFYPTSSVLSAMRENNWFPVMAVQARVKDESRQGFQKHMLRFRRGENIDHPREQMLEIVLINSHDGSSSYQLHAGVFRMVCSNGLVVAESTVENIRLMHLNFEPLKVIEGSAKILSQVGAVNADIDAMKARRLSSAEASTLAAAAVQARWQDPAEIPIRPELLLVPRRSADRSDDLWTTFNVVQENLLSGRLFDRTRRRPDGAYFKRTRQVNGIDDSVGINTRAVVRRQNIPQSQRPD